jgi:GTP-binding protein EngB required for normal cell division
MVELYLSTRPMLKAVFVLVDANIDATKPDREMLGWLNSIGMCYYVVANKIDRISQSKHVQQRQKLAKGLGCSPESIGWVSAKKGTGIDRLRVFLSSVIELR